MLSASFRQAHFLFRASGFDLSETTDRLHREAGDEADAHGVVYQPVRDTCNRTCPTFLGSGNIRPDQYTDAQRHEAHEFFCNQRMLALLPEIATTAAGSQHRACPSRSAVARRTKKASGIAKYLDILRNLPIRCEEAAEISECHSLTTLLPHVEQYIRIGDHQQLRPKIERLELRKNNTKASHLDDGTDDSMGDATPRSMYSGVCDQRSANWSDRYTHM
jgi:hypothetical protein